MAELESLTSPEMLITAFAGFRSLPLPVAQLSLAAVLQCGQSFRWDTYPLYSGQTSPHDTSTPTHEYRLCLRDRVVCLRQSPDTLWYRSVFPVTSPINVAEEREVETLAWIKDYFQLHIDLDDLYDQWGKRDPVFQTVKQRFAGIRMLRQDPFENLMSFICSSNNNIARITKMVKALCQHYSPPLVTIPPPAMIDGSCPTAVPLPCVYYPFPSPSSLASPEVSQHLRSLGFGYRAEFVQRTAQMLVEAHSHAAVSEDVQEPAEKFLISLRQRSTLEAREELLNFVGVGRKVADCVLLMSLDKREVIPVDTHVQQIAAKHYGLRAPAGKTNMTPKLYDEISNKMTAIWGDYAGWAHSVLFTSDLRAFASYGLPSPSPSPSKERNKVAQSGAQMPTAPDIPSPSPANRMKRRKSDQATTTLAGESHTTNAATVAAEVETVEELTMADRIKRRRRSCRTIVVSEACQNNP